MTRPNIFDYNSAKSALILAFNYCAPTGIEQRALVTVLHEMESKGEDHESVLLMLADAIANGLRHGNWPEAKSRPGPYKPDGDKYP